tara:strand:- start:242 stop:694 length:453 start_codon:yes stop_codon:yes gene_type:complete
MSNFHVREKHLFVEEDFIGHSGGQLHWKIECDAITSPEWKCLARMIMEYEKRPFQAAIGIPRGGVELGRWLNEYSTQNPDDPYLICDDVLTTGGSFDEFVDSYFRNRNPSVGYFGWCVFARDKPRQDWIQSLFQMPKTWVDNPNNLEYHK